ncbi:MAG: glycoside hydrolase family 9 protein [Bacteroidales bacterium]|nr:glycoside hydrolase family 9 protein [Bacteroidales bacterium]
MKYLSIFSMFFITIVLHSQTISKYICIDQFGYRPQSEKVAIIRDPQLGYDASESFTPGATYALVNTANKQQVFTSSLQIWNGGALDSTSGDKAWWFDFSTYTTAGEYYVLDVQKNVKSYTFKIQNDVYKDVLIQAFKTFFYQRSGFAKQTPYAGVGWVDGASHLGNLQDSQCRQWGKANDATTQRDVRGGWYDAGDLNKYTSWTAGYIMAMITMYEENTTPWTDDFQIPESGNGIPDILDEAKWGLDHLLRLQFSNGSCISVIGCSSASPPSAATGQSFWGGPSTSATLSCAAAYAYGAKIFKAIGNTAYANTLQTAAVNAWNWANANPSVLFYNNDKNYGTSGLAAGQQETDDYGRFCKKMNAAAHLYEITGNNTYKTYFESNYLDVNMMQWWYAFPYQAENQDILLYYTSIPNISATVKSDIIERYSSAMARDNQFGIIDTKKDPYKAHIESFTWGSSNVHTLQGSMFYSALLYNTNPSRNSDIPNNSEGYIHYLHGTNPLNKCYLSNMAAYGAENSVSEFYHTWFTENSPKWDNTITSTYGPAPGFLVGGPNPSFDWDGCCNTNTCGSAANYAKCFETSIEPPKNQPAQKSYKDFNNNWPLGSWSVTENSCGYQVGYLRLLSKFVSTNTTPTQTQEVALEPGWNLISTYLRTTDSSIATMFKDLDIIEIKNQEGFWRKNQALYLNSLHTITPGEGYLVKMNNTGTLSITGKEIFIINYQFSMPNAWLLIGCPFQTETPFSNYFNTSNCQEIKNFEGFWIPSATMNSITNLSPGKGYFLKTK